MIADARPPVRDFSRPRWCRCEDGTPKMAHPSRKAARAYGRRVWPDRVFHQYECRACGSYHNATGRDRR